MHENAVRNIGIIAMPEPPAKVAKGKKSQWVPLDPKLRQALEALPRHGMARRDEFHNF
jgi:hypothetical protein